MSIEVIDPPVRDPRNSSNDYHTPHRFNILGSPEKSYYFEKFVEGRDVLEIGCGMFGGLAPRVLKDGCRTYTGIDISSGNACKKVEYVDDNGRSDTLGLFATIKCSINISQEVKEDPRSRFVYGMDPLYFLRDFPDESLVTVSTGFFQECLLLGENGEGKDYVTDLIGELSRVTPKGENVGLHHVMIDDPPKESFGRLFIENFENFGVKTEPFKPYFPQRFISLSKV